MVESPQKLLESIPELVRKQDAAALVSLREHDDKKVRKAVRKALHTLKSKGVAIPDDPPRAWSTGGALQALRGELRASATIDTRSIPGATRFLLSEPDPDEGGRLFVGLLGPDDRVLEFSVYRQTDGQRARLLRDFTRRAEDRDVPVDWLKARIRWAREQTIASGFSVPRALDQALSSLGEAPSDRPESFLANELKRDGALSPESLDAVIVPLAVAAWPPLVELDATLQKAATLHGDKPQPTEESERLELLRQSIAGDEVIRKGLKGSIANALEDTSVHAWLDGNAEAAGVAAAMAGELREASEPETLPWVPRLLGHQVASLLRMVGGPDAIARAQRDAASGADDHDHDHA
jgi:hypothetical protein